VGLPGHPWGLISTRRQNRQKNLWQKNGRLALAGNWRFFAIDFLPSFVNEKEGRKSGAENGLSIGHAARPNEDLFFAPDILPLSPVRRHLNSGEFSYGSLTIRI
jgi:hypothetical protein